jgi:hypothetical protein
VASNGWIGVCLLSCLGVATLAGSFKAPKLNKPERAAIIRDASQAIHRYLRETDPRQRRGIDIPRELWGPAILKLAPVRVYDDHVNVAIVLKEDPRVEAGLYVSIPISSYAPGLDNRFSSFVRLSKRGDGTLGELYQYTIRKAQSELLERERIAGGAGLPPEGKPRPRVVFCGLDLTNAPVTTDYSKLPDLFEARPAGSGSYHIRPDVVQIRGPGSVPSSRIYYLPKKGCFYVQHDPIAASTLHYYGPFKGDPYRVLDLPRPEGEAGAAVEPAKR